MTGRNELPALAAIPRRPKPDRGARGRANPKRMLTTVEVRIFDPVACEIVTETAQAYIRALPPVLAGMPEPLQRAALTYAKAVEDVEAGGAKDPAASTPEFSAGGSAFKEGRQSLAVNQVAFLRKLEAVVGTGMVDLGNRCDGSKVSISRLEILRLVTVNGLTVAGLLAGLRLGRSTKRCKAVTAALLISITAMATSLGFIDDTKTTGS